MIDESERRFESAAEKEWTLEPRVTVGFVVAFVLFVAAGIAGFREQRYLAESGTWAMQTLDVIDQSRVIVRSLIDAETGQRGYLLTGADHFLVPYREAISSLPDRVAALERYDTDDPEQQRRLFALRPLVDADLAELTSTIELRRKGSSEEEALRQLWTNADDGTMQQIRSLVRQFQDTERARLERRIEAGVIRSTRSRSCIALATFVGAALAAASLFGMNRQSRRRIVAEREVVRIALAQREASAALESRNRALAALQVAQRDSEAANRTKDEFLALLSHELRSPLNAILGWVTLLRKGALPEAKVGHALGTIERNVHLQAQLVDDLLDVSRIVSGKFVLEEAPVDLSAVVHVAVENARLSAEVKGVRLTASLSSRSGVVIGDDKRLQQVVGNLLMNAIKFTPRGGAVNVTLSAHAGEAVLRVTDTGIGITKEFLPHVFDRFRQAEGSITRMHGGLGLGLSIVNTITLLHRGRVEAESGGVDRGATFTVRLPLRGSSVDVVEPRGETRGDELRGMKIVVVEDDSDAREALCLALQQSGASVKSCASTDEAMVALDQAMPDLIVSDIGMPGEDGYQFMRRVRKRDDTHVPAIAVTGFASKQDQEEAVKSGFDAHIAKPVLPDELVAKARDLLLRRRLHAV